MSSRWISTSLRSGLGRPLPSQASLPAHLGLRGLDQRRLAHAARAPQQGVVGRQALGEAARVVEQLLGGPVDALEQAERLAVDVRHGQEGLRARLPHEGLGRGELEGRRRPRGHALERRGEAVEGGQNGLFVGHRRAWLHGNWRKTTLWAAFYRRVQVPRHRRPVEVVAKRGQDTIFRAGALDEAGHQRAPAYPHRQAVSVSQLRNA